jgi:alpha-beta hydrolase superfamily lysophospholipase
MHAASLRLGTLLLRRPRWLLRGAVAALATLAGVTSLEVQQRRWIFQTGLSGNATRAQAGVGLQEQWIGFDSDESGAPAALHGLWLPQTADDAPVLLFLHGARWDIRNCAQRMRSLHALGFSVLGIDYRGFGQSTAALPSERLACEDARAAWRWLAQAHPQAQRYIYGHSLGGAIAVQLATRVNDAAGLIVEGTFTSIPEVIGLNRGWRRLAPLITQRFDSAGRIHQVKVPTLVVHGGADVFIRPELGRALFDRVASPKRFLLVPGGTHHDTHALGQAQYREALRELFGLTA